VKAYQKCGLPLATGMEIGYVVRDASKWEVDTERDASSEFDVGYYGKLLEKAWDEVAFVLQQAHKRISNIFGLAISEKNYVNIFDLNSHFFV